MGSLIGMGVHVSGFSRFTQIYLFSAIACFYAFAATQPASSEACAIGKENGKIAIRGLAKVEDGDTIWVGIHKVRLYGIEALEEDQPCTKDNERQNCAERSIQALTRLVEGHTIKCLFDIGKRGEPIMSYNRYLAVCYLSNGAELNRMLVRDGWVISDRSPKGEIYREDEEYAAKHKLGIHDALFDLPKAYRKSKNQPAKDCPTGFQCVRSNRTDVEELLRALKNSE